MPFLLGKSRAGHFWRISGFAGTRIKERRVSATGVANLTEGHIVKKRTKNIIKGIFIPLAVTVSLLIAVGGFYWTKLDKLQFSDGKVESCGTVDNSDDDVLKEESRMIDAISGLKEQEVINASGDVNENRDYINILLIGTDELSISVIMLVATAA